MKRARTRNLPDTSWDVETTRATNGSGPAAPEFSRIQTGTRSSRSTVSQHGRTSAADIEHIHSTGYLLAFVKPPERTGRVPEPMARPAASPRYPRRHLSELGFPLKWIHRLAISGIRTQFVWENHPRFPGPDESGRKSSLQQPYFLFRRAASDRRTTGANAMNPFTAQCSSITSTSAAVCPIYAEPVRGHTRNSVKNRPGASDCATRC